MKHPEIKTDTKVMVGMLKDYKELGFNQGIKKAEQLIDKRIFWQKVFLKKQPENRKSIEWRILGFEELKQKLKENK